MELNVPKQVRDALSLLDTLSKDEADRFLAAVRAAKPRVAVDGFVSEVAAACAIADAKVRDLVSALVSMYWAMGQSGLPLNDFVSNVLAALQKADVKLGDPEFFRQRVKTLLEQEESLGVTAKAMGLATDYERSFRSCRILSDVRYIFGNDPNAPPKAAVINHSLNFVYSEIDSTKQIYVALDGSDLKRLSEAIGRAAAKEQNLRSMLQKQGINCLPSET